MQSEPHFFLFYSFRLLTCSARRSHQYFFTESFLYAVNGIVELYRFFCIIEETDLVGARNQVGKANADQSHQHAAIVEAIEYLLCRLQQHMVGIGVRNGTLYVVSFKIRIPDLHSHAACKTILSP